MLLNNIWPDVELKSMFSPLLIPGLIVPLFHLHSLKLLDVQRILCLRVLKNHVSYVLLSHLNTLNL